MKKTKVFLFFVFFSTGNVRRNRFFFDPDYQVLKKLGNIFFLLENKKLILGQFFFQLPILRKLNNQTWKNVM